MQLSRRRPEAVVLFVSRAFRIHHETLNVELANVPSTYVQIVSHLRYPLQMSRFRCMCVGPVQRSQRGLEASALFVSRVRRRLYRRLDVAIGTVGSRFTYVQGVSHRRYRRHQLYARPVGASTVCLVVYVG